MSAAVAEPELEIVADESVGAVGFVRQLRSWQEDAGKKGKRLKVQLREKQNSRDPGMDSGEPFFPENFDDAGLTRLITSSRNLAEDQGRNLSIVLSFE